MWLILRLLSDPTWLQPIAVNGAMAKLMGHLERLMIEKSLSLSKLTQKQREVLALVADNRTSKEIAALLSISESAVNQRIEMVRTRLGGLPRGELARLYRKELNFKSLEEEAKLLTCEKLQVPESQQFGQGPAREVSSEPRPEGLTHWLRMETGRSLPRLCSTGTLRGCGASTAPQPLAVLHSSLRSSFRQLLSRWTCQRLLPPWVFE